MRDQSVLEKASAHPTNEPPVLDGGSCCVRTSTRTLPGRLRSRLRGSCLLLVAALAAVSASPAHAQDDASVAMARERFKEGVQFFDQKQFDKARAAFLQAYALKKHPAVLLNLAQSELRSGHEADAAKHFAQYLREHKEATDSERQGAEAGLTSAKASVAELTVHVDQDGASVLVDGDVEGITPLPGPLYLSPGSHNIRARKDGQEVDLQVTTSAGQSSATNLRFRKAKAAAAPSTPAGADEEQEEPPADPDDDEESSSPESARGERQSFFAWSADSPIAWMGGAVTIAGVAGGIGFAVAATSNFNTANSIAGKIRDAAAENNLTPEGICGPDPSKRIASRRPADFEVACDRYSDNVDRGENLRTFSIASWVIAGVAASGTVIAYLADGTEDPPADARSQKRVTARVLPWVSADGPGLSVSGEF